MALSGDGHSGAVAGPDETVDRQTLIAMLRWQFDAGVDEAVSDVPWDRFAEPTRPPAPSQATVADAPERRPDAPLRRPERPARPAPAQPPAAGPSRLRVADLDGVENLESLRARLDGIDGGAPQRFATSTVFGDGAPGACIMFVGEAPGAEEDRQGAPFVGPSGKLLERMLAAIGLRRSDVYIANTLYWRPPGNRTPTPEERNACLPLLMRQIELVAPKIVVPLGGPAAQTLLNQTAGITRLRGRWFDFETRPGATGGYGAPALATFHPAFLLRQPAQKKQVWQDLRAIRAKLKGLGG